MLGERVGSPIEKCYRKSSRAKVRWEANGSPTKGDRPASGKPSAPLKIRSTTDAYTYASQRGHYEHDAVLYHPESANTERKIPKTSDQWL